MKRFFIILFLFFIPLQLFCHRAEKQSFYITPEPITSNWLECEKILHNTYINDSTFYSDYLEQLETFLKVANETTVSDTVIYYYPQLKEIVPNISALSQTLMQVTENWIVSKKEKKAFLYDAEVLSLRSQIFLKIQDWEILHKNLNNAQLKQIYYSYNTLILVIVITTLLTLVFFVLYLLVSKNRREVKTFTKQMLQAQEQERERISNELHDTVCQDLRVLQFKQEEIVDKISGELQSKIEESINLCKKISSNVRNTCYALTPSDLNEGLLEAIISFSQLCAENSAFNLVLSIQDDIKEKAAIKEFTREKNLHIYRVVQEIMNNIEKHAEAESASILIRSFDNNNFKIIISDDGKGFDMKKVSKKRKHFGLINLLTRVKAINGSISINSEVGAGTQVTVTIPY
ncbi:MAG: sensor histidine kinase [Treponema sp.]|nr:sensor histidine kinase [Treponema sp.]